MVEVIECGSYLYITSVGINYWIDDSNITGKCISWIGIRIECDLLACFK